MKLTIALSLSLAASTGAASDGCVDWLPVFIPTPKQCPTCDVCPVLPTVPEGCTHYTTINPTVSVPDWRTLQLQAGPWLQEVQHVIEVDQSQCQWDSWASRWDCTVSWDVPEGAWWWQWKDSQVPLATQRCVWGS